MTVRYRYDALGRRVQRSASGGRGSTKFVYDGDDVIVDDNGNGNKTTYLNADGIDNKLKMKTGSDPSKYFVTDHLGSTIGLAGADGSVSNPTSYDSFGNTTSTLPTRYRYTGREYDEFSGLYHYRARSYDPKTGRFMSEDPIGLSGGINQFAYVGNNPLSATDPLGLQAGPVNFLRNPFSVDHWVLNGLSNTVSDFLLLDHVAEWSWTIGDHRCSDSDRMWAGAKLGGWIAFQVVQGWIVGKIVGKIARYVGPGLRRVLFGVGDELIETGVSRLPAETPATPVPKVRNGKLAGDVHPKTGVPFDEAGFPDFTDFLYKDGINNVEIAPTGTRSGDFAAANQAAGYSSTPKGYTWHHHQDYGVMQLVESEVHAMTGHSGGFSTW